MHLYLILLYFLFFSFFFPSLALGADFERLYETFVRENTIEEEDSDLYYLLEAYYQKPLDINQASPRALAKLPLFSPRVIKSILKKRKNKPFIATVELVSLGWVPKEDFERLRHFITVKPPRQKKIPLTIDIINNFVINHNNGGPEGISFLQTRNLHQLTNNREYGHNFFRVEHKFQFEIPRQVEGHFTVQRDAYEESYIDLIKGALLLEFPFSLEQICLGALSVVWGQGVMFSTSTGNAYPHADRVIQHRKNSKLDIGRGTTENYLLGIGVSLALEKIFIQGFSGAFNYDGELISSDFQKQVEHFRSIKTDKLHDSTNALRQKNRQWEFLTGVNVDYRWGPEAYVGMSLLYSEFLYPLKPEVSDTLDNYKFYGKRYGAMSLHWSIAGKAWVSFGEVMGYFTPNLSGPRDYAFEDNLPYTFEPGALIGLTYGEKRNFRGQLSFRYYSPYLIDLHSRGFSQSGSRGEVGFYGGVDWWLHRRFKWKLFIDIADSLYPQISRDIETTFGSKFDWQIYDKIKFALRGSLNFETEQLESGNETPGTDANLKAELSYDHQYFFIRAQGLFGGEYFDNLPNPNGMAGLLEIDISPIPWLILKTRSLLHDTEISLYTGNENIPGLFTGNRILSGRGWGVDLAIQVTIAKMFNLAIKYGYAHRTREEDEELITRVSEEIQAQFRFQY